MPRRPNPIDRVSDLRLRSIGKPFQNWRQKAGLTQKQVADALGYTTAQFISNWERGAALPPLSMLPRLAELYAVEPSEVIDVMHEYERQMMELQLAEVRRLLLGSRGLR